LFKVSLPHGQEVIVRTIAFGTHKRVSINAYTRYGKSFAVGIGVDLYILLNENKQIALIAPKREQAGIIRDYILDGVMRCRQLQEIIELQRGKKLSKLKSEASRYRQTFKNGMEYRIFTAHGDASGIMGFGANGIIIIDEAAKIKRDAYAKILRMLGDAPDTAIMVEITNPWDRDTVAYDHYTDPEWFAIHIDWQQGIKEGRTTQKHIDEMRKEMAPIMFVILYDSNYPDESDDSLVRFSWIIDAEEQVFNLMKTYKQAILDNSKLPEKDREKIPAIKTLASIDPAEFGRDFTVLMIALVWMNKYEVMKIYYTSKKDPTDTARWAEKYLEKTWEINVDAIGIGSGVCSTLRADGYRANDIKVGRSPTNHRLKDTRLNQKAEFFWYMATALSDGRVSIPVDRTLRRQLLSMKYTTVSGKVRIIDPEDKSPDWADAFMLLFAVAHRGTVLF
jgi:hypothetical protein